MPRSIGKSATSGSDLPEVKVRVIRLPHGRDLPLPAYQTEHAAGLDLLAAIPFDQPLLVPPGARTLVPTGLSLELPQGYEAQVRPRSGLALKHGVTVLNSPGTIDADYRGEVGVLLVNLGGAPFEIRRGERIAQLVIAPVVRAILLEVESLETTARGEGGFGSTGVSEAGKETSGAPSAAPARPEPPAATAPPKKKARAPNPARSTTAKPRR